MAIAKNFGERAQSAESDSPAASSIVVDAQSDAPIVLPSSRFATDAEFLQQGDDLLLIGPEGTTVLVRDYFLTDTPPDLMTPDGGRLTAALIQSFTPPEAVAQFAQLGGGVSEAIGQVSSVVGTVFAVRTNGARVQLGAGDPVFQGDVVETGDGGSVNILFVDKTTFALGGDARLALDKLIFNSETHEGSSSFSILKGVFVFASGEIAKLNPLDMTVNTTVATIGIRGTKVAGEVNPAGEVSKFTILEGKIIVTTDEGSVELSDLNATTLVTGFDAPPSRQIILSDTEINSNYGEVKAISGNFFAGKNTRGDDAFDDDANGEGAANANNGEDDLDPDVLAETVLDLAPAAGGDGEGEGEGSAEGVGGELLSSNGDEFDIVDGGLGSGGLGGSDDDRNGGGNAQPGGADNTGTGLEPNNNTAQTTLTLPETVIDIAPAVSGLTAQSVQAAPTLIAHDLSTDTSIAGLRDRNSVPGESINGVAPSDLTLSADHPVSVTFIGETAGFRNTLGTYKIADDGQITDVTIVFENASQLGSGGRLIPGESTVALDAVAGDRLGFFIIANGFSVNNFNNFSDGAFEFRDGGAAATTASINPTLVFVRGDGAEISVSGRVYHTTPGGDAAPLNLDGLVHTLSGLDEDTGGLTIGFEDLPGLGDRDYDDAIFRVDFGLADGEVLDPVPVAPDVVLGNVRGGNLTSAVIEIADGFVLGDSLLVGALAGTGIAVAEQGFDAAAGVYRLTLSGDATSEDYEAALASVRLASETATSGPREIAIQVTGSNGVQSETVVTSVTVEPVSVLVGTDTADTLVGDAGNDRIEGGLQDDLLIGNGGADVLRGGDGDDRLVIGDDRFVLAAGGEGTDTLAVNFDFDLSVVNNNAISGIERFDLGNGSGSILTIGLDDVLAASDGVNILTGIENTLVINRDAADTVRVIGDDISITDETLDTDNDGVNEGYTVFTDNTTGAAVYVENVA